MHSAYNIRFEVKAVEIAMKWIAQLQTLNKYKNGKDIPYFIDLVSFLCSNLACSLSVYALKANCISRLSSLFDFYSKR